METFKIARDTPIVLYGVSKFSCSLGLKLKNLGYNIIAYLDKRAEEINFVNDCPVYTLESAPFSENDKKNHCVILCFQNITQHINVSKILFAKNYKNILFLPYAENLKPNIRELFYQAYNELIYNYQTSIKIPCYNELFDHNFLDNEHRLLDYGNEVVTYVPLELISSRTSQGSLYHEKNISCFVPFISLFDFMENNRYESLLNYTQYYTNILIEYDEANHIKSRVQLYNIYASELNKGMDFFIQSAPKAVYLEQKGFCLLDGHHRTIFLYSRGINRFPIRLSREDYYKWINESVSKKLKFLLNKNHITSVDSIIPTPYFMNLPEVNPGLVYQILRKIGFFLNFKFVSFNLGIEISNYNGFFSRFFAREGCKQVICLERDSFKKKLALLVNELLYIQNIYISPEFNEWESVDVAFISTDIVQLKDILPKLKNSKIIFMEQDIKKIYNGIFSIEYYTYSQLGTYFKNNNLYELGVLKYKDVIHGGNT